MKRLLLLVFFFCFCMATGTAQGSAQPLPAVFLDCPSCDKTYLQEQLNFVHFARDRKDADIYILGIGQQTGGGGREYTFYFQGQKQFARQNDTLRINVAPQAPYEGVRQQQLKIIKQGLLPYVLQSPAAKHITYTYTPPDTAASTKEEEKDKWNRWVFGISANGSLSGEEYIKSYFLFNSASAKRVTEALKIEAGANISTAKTLYKTTDYEFTSRSYSGEGLVVKSLSGHWSAGGFISGFSSLYANMALSANISPALEYNIFPYSEYNKRQFSFLYKAGVQHNNYIDTTIYNQIEEVLYLHSLSARLRIIESWGMVTASLKGSNYLHDFNKKRLDFNTSLSIFVLKGLSFNIFGNASLIHDQINLARGSASEEEVLLQQRQLQTGYSYSTSIGISYTFGSVYNNVVNPRFGY